MNDDEMIAHYAGIAEKLGGKAVARYKNAICFVKNDNEIYESFADDLSGNSFCIVSKPHEKRVPGFPIDSLSVYIESGEYYLDVNKKRDGYGWSEGFRTFFRGIL